MRPRLRSQSGPQAARDGRPLELVRLRGSQRDTRDDSRPVRRSRRRGGRGRGGRSTPPPPPPRRSFWDWLTGFFAPAPPSTPAARAASVSDQEARILHEFEAHFDIHFHQPALLKLALTHRSYLHVTGQGPRDSNERLEFLGDSVLGLVTSENLYRAHPTEHEGQLTKTKSLLVSKAILSRRALAMGLGRFVLMSHSEVESGGRQRLSILADAFEAVVGAIYLDQGFDVARSFIERWLLRDARVIAADKRHTNYKSHLQEYVQSTFRTHPVYRIRSEVGPDHSKQFMVEVIVGKRSLGEGKGRNKKEAEQAAARHALERVERGSISDRQARLAEQAPAAPAPRVRVEPDASSRDLERTGETGRRTRGRRGGRGRRGRNGEERTAPAAEARTSAVDVPPPSPASARAERSQERRPRTSEGPRTSEAPRSEAQGTEAQQWQREVVRPRELEPPPKAYEEDENEEVGRPEGPHEERRVDPYSWESRSAPPTASEEPPSVPDWIAAVRPDAPSGREESRPEVEAEEAGEAGEVDEPAGQEHFPPSSQTRQGQAAPSGFGRRPGRGRRR